MLVQNLEITQKTELHVGVALVCPSIAAGAQHLLQLGILCFFL